jgi:hypothetical protein
MDIAKSLSYIFDDDEWPEKVGLGGLIMLVPVLNFVGMGYEAQVIRNVAQGEPRPLPMWNDLGSLFMDGLWLALARLAYALPIFALTCLPVSLMVPLFATAQTDEQINERFPFILLVCGISFVILMGYGVVMGLVSPAITAMYIRRGTFAACFDFVGIVSFIRDNLSNYLLAWLGTIAVSLLLNAVIGPVGFVLSFIPCLGTIAYFLLIGASTFVILLVTGHLIGQLIRADHARLGGMVPTPLS